MALVITVKVVPGAGRQQWQLDGNHQFKCYLKSQPEKGLANKELIILLAKALRLPQQDIEIILGAISRKKTIKIHAALTYDQLLAALGIDQQTMLFDKK